MLLQPGVLQTKRPQTDTLFAEGGFFCSRKIIRTIFLVHKLPSEKINIKHQLTFFQLVLGWVDFFFSFRAEWLPSMTKLKLRTWTSIKTLQLIIILALVVTGFRFLSRFLASWDRYVSLKILTIFFQDLKNGEEVARCPSCSLIIKVIYTASQLPELPEKKEEKSSGTSVSRAAEIAAH